MKKRTRRRGQMGWCMMRKVHELACIPNIIIYLLRCDKLNGSTTRRHVTEASRSIIVQSSEGEGG